MSVVRRNNMALISAVIAAAGANPPWIVREDGSVAPVPTRWLVGY